MLSQLGNNLFFCLADTLQHFQFCITDGILDTRQLGLVLGELAKKVGLCTLERQQLRRARNAFSVRVRSASSSSFTRINWRFFDSIYELSPTVWFANWSIFSVIRVSPISAR